MIPRHAADDGLCRCTGAPVAHDPRWHGEEIPDERDAR